MPFSFKPTQDTTPPPTLSAEGLTNRFKESKSSLFTFLAAVVFGVTLVLSLVLFLYQQKLQRDVTEQQTKLAQYDTRLQDLPINDMIVLSARMKVAKKLVTEHASVATAFRILEDSIEHPITYSQFDFKREQTKESYSIVIAAKSPDYKTVIQQQETLKNKPYSDYMPDLTFSGVSADEKGTVNFSIKSTILIKKILPEEFIIKTNNETRQVPSVNQAQ